jgi:hypothetical protein
LSHTSKILPVEGPYSKANKFGAYYYISNIYKSLISNLYLSKVEEKNPIFKDFAV